MGGVGAAGEYMLSGAGGACTLWGDRGKGAGGERIEPQRAHGRQTERTRRLSPAPVLHCMEAREAARHSLDPMVEEENGPAAEGSCASGKCGGASGTGSEPMMGRGMGGFIPLSVIQMPVVRSRGGGCRSWTVWRGAKRDARGGRAPQVPRWARVATATPVASGQAKPAPTGRGLDPMQKSRR